MTSRILLEKLSFSYVAGEAIFENLSLTLSSGWLGVVGGNGSGKSTLLRLLDGSLQPTGGQVLREPEWAYVVHCPQSVEVPDPSIAAFADDDGSTARRLRAQLALNAPDLLRWATLSPGERKRWQVGAALSLNPLILLLDEPSNHLDSSSHALLLQALLSYRGVGVLVSHDRRLLDALCHATLWLEEGVSPSWFPGAYSSALPLREQAQRAAEARYAEADATLRKARRQVESAQERAASIERSRNASSRRRNLGDREAASMSAKVRFDRAASRGTRGASQAERLASAAASEREALRTKQTHRGPIHFDWEAPRQRLLLDISTQSLAIECLSLPDLSYLQIPRDAKIRISGPNGAGKSTLIRCLLTQLRLPADRITYLPQEFTAAESATLIQRVRQLPPEQLGKFIPLFTRLGASATKLLRGDPLSPGDTRKLALAEGLARSSHILLLDEPTNHLDLPAVEALQDALIAYPGAVVLVSHDEVFARAVAGVEWGV